MRIKLNSISFNEHNFRKLGNMELEIAPRITVIAGHNGIGKSTILGLIANGSEYSKNSTKSYFEKSFRAEFSELFYLDLENELVSDKNVRPEVTLSYSVKNGDTCEEVLKVCSVSKQKTPNKFRARIIPRTSTVTKNNLQDFLKDNDIGDAAKMPIPTLYLGMSRMSPIGEYEEAQITTRKNRSAICEEDRKYIADKTDQIISADLVEAPDIISHDFKYSKKSSKVPEYKHSSLSISLGQDSLSSIITALASFKKVKRELGDKYPGGILLIDELDAGFHPIAQIKLIKLFKKEARDLNLQIIVTTHSLTILKEILAIPEGQKEKGKVLDNVIYIRDTLFPKIVKDPTYTKIKNDLFLHAPPSEEGPQTPEVKVYFEDQEAEFVFKKIIDKIVNKSSTAEVFGVNFKCISLSIGTDVLLQLHRKDDYFSKVLIIPDNDVLSESKNRELVSNTPTIIPLPQSTNMGENESPKLRTPEAIVYCYIKEKYDNALENKDFWDQSDRFTTDYVRENILTLTEDELTATRSREYKKDWFNSNNVKTYIEERHIIELWCHENKSSLEGFKQDLLYGIRTLLDRGQ